MRGARRKVGGAEDGPGGASGLLRGPRGGRGDRGLRHGWRGTRWGGAALVRVPAASPGAKEAGLLGCHGNRRARGAWSGPGELHPKAEWARVAWPRGFPGGNPAPVILGGGALPGLSLPGGALAVESNLGHPERLQEGVPHSPTRMVVISPPTPVPQECRLPTRVPARGIVSPAISVPFAASPPTSTAPETDAEQELQGPQRDLASVPGEP